MERVDYEGQIATAFSLARILSATPLTITGPSKLVMYDIHALQERFYFGDCVIPILETAVPLFLNELKLVHHDEKVAIVFPDEGAQKRFGRDFPSHYPQIICSKVREGNKRVVKIKEGTVDGCHCFIVDDLVKTGGTLIECKTVLRANGAAKVSAYVTHPVFPQESWKRFAKEGPDEFQIFYITNTLPVMASLLAKTKPFKVLSIASLLANVLFKY